MRRRDGPRVFPARAGTLYFVLTITSYGTHLLSTDLGSCAEEETRWQRLSDSNNRGEEEVIRGRDRRWGRESQMWWL